MTTLTVDINNEQEERVLLAFLNSLKYNYKTGTQPGRINRGTAKKKFYAERRILSLVK